MKLSPEQSQELIDRYLREELSEADAQLFAEVRYTPEFERELRLMEEVRQASIARGRQQLQTDMAAWEAELAPAVQVIRPLWQRSGFLISIAAGISLLLVIFLWPRQAATPEGAALFAAHFEVYPDFQSDNTRSEGQEATLLDYTMEAYRMGEYEAALRGFDSLQSQEAGLIFYEGVSLLGAGRSEEASETFSKINEGSFLPPARWYLALAAIQMEEWEVARQRLLEITQAESHPFQKEAEELLQHIAGA
ncbi:MAG: hypothetical protein AAF399_10920 [Bacteroidota bacterium]